MLIQQIFIEHLAILGAGHKAVNKMGEILALLELTFWRGQTGGNLSERVRGMVISLGGQLSRGWARERWGRAGEKKVAREDCTGK